MAKYWSRCILLLEPDAIQHQWWKFWVDVMNALHSCGFQWIHEVRLAHTQWFCVLKSLRLKSHKLSSSINFLPENPVVFARYTMIPASVFLGFTASILWVAEVTDSLYAIQMEMIILFLIWTWCSCNWIIIDVWEWPCDICLPWVMTSVL